MAVQETTVNPLVSEWYHNFIRSMVSKSAYTKKWQKYEDAYKGEYFKDVKLPDYRSNMVSNYVYSVVETIRPIMLDNNPRFQALPRQPEGVKKIDIVQKIFDYEWDREYMSTKLSKELINTLVLGNSVFFLPWCTDTKQVKAIPVSPYNIFPDPLATSIEDAEYIIYAKYMHENKLKKMFPEHAEKFQGGDITYSELVYENDKQGSRVDNQILVLEVWAHDWTTFDEEEEGFKKKKFKYPRGRVLGICPEIDLMLYDKENPYKDGEFPFVLIKDYDIPGKFWGNGEVEQLLSPQQAINDLNNQIIDNAKQTANMPWILDKNSGIGQGKITNRPGLVIRKNPGSEVRRDQPPSMPAYVPGTVDTIKEDMEQISGVFDTLKGNSEKGVYTAQGLLALQEAGQARIRLKVKLLEKALGMLQTKWYSRIKQYWKNERYIRITGNNDASELVKVTPADLKCEYDIKILSGSTMQLNKGAMLDLLIRMAQTPMEDGLPMVDREAILPYLPLPEKQAIIDRFAERAQQQQIQNEYIQQNEQEHEEIKGILEQIGQSLQELQTQVDKMLSKDEKRDTQEKFDNAQRQGYNNGYRDAEATVTATTQTREGETPTRGTAPQPEESVVQQPQSLIPDEVLDQLEQLNDEQLMALMERYPELEKILTGEQV